MASYNELSLSQWLNFRLQVLGVAMLTGVAFLAAAQNHLGHVNAGLVGLSISYSLSVTGLLQVGQHLVITEVMFVHRKLNINLVS